MRIGRVDIGLTHPPFVVAEMSGNHNQSLERALQIVEAAAAAGAHAIKLQTYTADTLTLDVREGPFVIDSAHPLWGGKSLYELYSQAYTPWEWHAPIMKRAGELGIQCFSSPFDESAVEFLEELGVPAYKIASFENNHIPLIRKAAATGKPLVISTGLASVSEIGECVSAARAAGCSELMLLKCTSSYPASPRDSNVLTIPHMRQTFGCEVGLSDHTPGIGTAIAAVAHGATLVEKHFTLSRDDGGVDSEFSIEPAELESLVIETARAWESLGQVQYEKSDSEVGSGEFRRSLYVAEDMKAGDVFTAENLRVIRPGLGLHPRYYELLLGRTVSRDARKGEPIEWGMV